MALLLRVQHFSSCSRGAGGTVTETQDLEHKPLRRRAGGPSAAPAAQPQKETWLRSLTGHPVVIPDLSSAPRRGVQSQGGLAGHAAYGGRGRGLGLGLGVGRGWVERQRHTSPFDQEHFKVWEGGAILEHGTVSPWNRGLNQTCHASY